MYIPRILAVLKPASYTGSHKRRQISDVVSFPHQHLLVEARNKTGASKKGELGLSVDTATSKNPLDSLFLCFNFLCLCLYFFFFSIYTISFDAYGWKLLPQNQLSRRQQYYPNTLFFFFFSLFNFTFPSNIFQCRFHYRGMNSAKTFRGHNGDPGVKPNTLPRREMTGATCIRGCSSYRLK